MDLFNNIFENKTVLITGHTGFKGSWLSAWLKLLGSKVVGFSDCIPTSPSNYEASNIYSNLDDNRGDIRILSDIKSVVKNTQPDFIFHLAAQALVNNSYEDPIQTITVNALGTANILESIRQLDKKVVVVMITSDKAYDNVEWIWGYRENDRLGGKDLYSASKGMAELVIKGYFESFFKNNSNISLGIARAGNVIGGGDWAKDRIVPDCVTAWSNNQKVDIRSPNATRPWQHVLEPLSGYLLLASNLSKNHSSNGEAYNFGPSSNQDYSVAELINEMSLYWDQVNWRDTSESKTHNHEAGLLKLNCDKALFDLNWTPTLDFQETIKMTADWYKEYYEQSNVSMSDITTSQIIKYNSIAKSKLIKWASND